MAFRITEAYRFDEKWAVNVDFDRGEYCLCWAGNWRDMPDTTTFPELAGGAAVTQIQPSKEVRRLWAASSHSHNGAESHIRVLVGPKEAFPMWKVSVDERQWRLIRDELLILRIQSEAGAPFVAVHRELLTDVDGVFGFRMERLLPVDLETNTFSYVRGAPGYRQRSRS